MEKFRDMFELIRLGSDEEIVSKIISDLKILKELGENFALTEACIYYGEELKSKNKYSAIDLLLSTLDDSILCFRVITSFINCFYSAREKLPSYDNFWKKSLQIFPDKIGILQRYEWLMLNKEETEILKIKFRDSTTFICTMKVMRASKYEITARDILDILENKKVCDPDKHMMIVSSIFSELTKVSGVDIYAAFKMFYLTK